MSYKGLHSLDKTKFGARLREHFEVVKEVSRIQNLISQEEEKNKGVISENNKLKVESCVAYTRENNKLNTL